MAVASFIFGGDTGETPESLRRKRKMLEALFGSTAAPKNVGEGLAALGNAFLFRRMNNQVNAGEQAGQRSASDAMAALFGGGGDFPSAPAAGPAAKALFGKSDTSRTGSTIDFAHASDGASPASAGGIEAYIREAAAARGIDPDVAVTVARSEGGLKDPVRQSLVRKNGRQEPSYGPFQLLIGGGDTGFPAGMGNDALAAGIDPRDPSQWQRGIDFALDNAAKNGWGAWYGAKAAGIGNRQGIGRQRQAQQQVASLDPSIGLPEAQEQPQQTAGIFVGRPDQMPPQQAPTPTPRPQQPVQQPAPQPQQVAQARQPMPEAEAEADALSALGAQPASSGPSLQQLYQAARNPWLSEQDRALVNSMIQQKTQEQDPLRQLQLMKARIDLQKAQAGDGADYKVVNDRLIKTYPDGRVEDVTPSVPEGAGPTGPFSGSSVEAQSLNLLVANGRLTPEQAAQIGAGKPITDPSTGAIIFMTPEGIFQQERGQQPQPLGPQGGGSQLLAPMPLGGSGQMQPRPHQAPVPQPAARPGAIPLTPPKQKQIPDATRNSQAKVNQAFDTIGGELDRYAELVGKHGVEAMPGEAKDNLNSVRQGIMLQMKELFNLGVLNGPDLSLMERMIYDPVIDPMKEGGIANLPGQMWDATVGNPGARAQNSVNELKRMLTNIRDATNRAAAGTVGAPAAASPPPGGTQNVPAGVDPADWEFMTPEERAEFQ